MASRDEAIQAGINSMAQGQKDALGGAYDAGAASQPVPVPTPGTVTQAQYNDAVAQVKAESDSIAALTKKLGLDDAQVAHLTSAIGGLAQEINAILAPVVTPPAST